MGDTDVNVAKVKEAADIVAVAARYASLKPCERLFTARCPYNDCDDAKHSFEVSGERGLYYCRRCRRGGDALQLVSDLEGVSEAEALALLADRFGVALEPGSDPDLARALDGTARLRKARRALGYAAAYWSRLLLEGDHPECRAARDYLLRERGIPREILEEYRVGYAPTRAMRKSFRLEARRFNVSGDALRDAGLVKNGRGGRLRDLFWGRITFPWMDELGRTLAFGARLVPGVDVGTRKDGSPYPKYLNSPETEVFNKHRLLYGLGPELPRIRETGRALIVEGYTDVLALRAVGIWGAVATAGTATTPEHLRLLAPHAEEVYLLFDPDSGGRGAVGRALDVADARQRLRVAALDADPADLARERGRAGVVAALREAKTGREYDEDRLHEALAAGAEGKDEGARREKLGGIERLLAGLAGEEERKRLTRRAATALGLTGSSA